MKEVVFKSYEMDMFDKSAYNMPFDEIKKSKSLKELKDKIAEIEKNKPKVKFDWKQILNSYMQSEEFGKLHPLQTVKQISNALDAYKITESKTSNKVKVSDEVVALFKSAAASLKWVKMSPKSMEYAIEFKKYFESL